MFDTLTVGLEAGESHRQEDEVVLRVLARELAAPEPAAPAWAYTGGRGDGLPSDLSSLPVGLGLAAVVFMADRSSLSGYDLVRLLEAEDRLVSAFQARRYQTITQISEVFDDREASAAEVGAALHLTRAASESEVKMADSLTQLPNVLAALGTGAIDQRRARTIVEGVKDVQPETAATILDRVLPDAPDLTTGQLRARLARVCAELDPGSANDRYEAGVEQRRVVLSANPDTTANLAGYDLPPDLASAAAKRINWLARKARTKDDPRTLDQIRADVFLDLLTGRGQSVSQTGGPAGQVDIVADLRALNGESDTPGHIPGFGPVVAEIARKVAAHQVDCRWEYTVTDQGRPIATGTIRRRPTAGMKRRIRAQHPTCVWPGCRMPARQSDLDHRHRWSDGGTTTVRNLAPLCDRHHELLDKGWRYEPTSTGDYRFVSPLGHTYISSGRSP